MDELIDFTIDPVLLELALERSLKNEELKSVSTRIF